MKRKLLIFSLALLTASLVWAGSNTTYLNLYKPAVGDKNWGAQVNANFDTLDTAVGTKLNANGSFKTGAISTSDIPLLNPSNMNWAAVDEDTLTAINWDSYSGGGGAVSDEAYGINWDSVTDIAPSKNAVYDKIQSLGGGHDAVTLSGRDYITLSDQELILLQIQGDDINWSSIVNQQLFASGINWTDYQSIPGSANNWTDYTSFPASGVNWTDFISEPAVAINWTDFVNEPASTNNWTDYFSIPGAANNWTDYTSFPAGAVNWTDFVNEPASAMNWTDYQSIPAGGVNWTDVQLAVSNINWAALQEIQTGDINWTSITSQEEFATGINWTDFYVPDTSVNWAIQTPLYETDPKISTLTNTKWCSTNGSVITCTQDAPAGSGDVTDVGNCASGACFGGASSGGYSQTFYNVAGNGVFSYDGTKFSVDKPLSAGGTGQSSFNQGLVINSLGGATSADDTAIYGDTVKVLGITATGNILLGLGAWDLSGATFKIPDSASLPGTCAEGTVYQDTDSGGTEFYICTATNTWTKTIAATDNVATATALASNGANCSANQAAGGVSASGAAEDCTAYLTAETDPQVGAVTSAKVCEGDASAVQCDLTQDGSGDCAASAVCTGGHTHSQYATLADPTFTGDPKAPTPAANDNDTSIATTAFVQGEVPDYVQMTLLPQGAVLDDGAPPALTVIESTGTGTPRFYVADFDPTTDEILYWTIQVPDDMGAGNWLLDVSWYSNDTGANETCCWGVGVSATTEADADTMAEQAISTIDYACEDVNATEVNRLVQTTITISDLDSVAAGDVVTFQFRRDADSTNGTSDDLTSDARFVSARLRIPRT